MINKLKNLPAFRFPLLNSERAFFSLALRNSALADFTAIVRIIKIIRIARIARIVKIAGFDRFAAISPTAVFISLVLLFACGEAKPLTRQPNEAVCKYCNMSVVDMRFHTQAVSDGGRHIDFDSIECALWWMNKNQGEDQGENQGKIKALWTHNHSKPQEWLSLIEKEPTAGTKEQSRSKALLLHSEKIASPMAGGLAAYANAEQLAAARKRYGGQERRLSQLLKEYLQKQHSMQREH